MYATAVARENGDMFFYPDIYGHDRKLDGLLRKGYPYPRR
jgi:murein L,D-transpeptidase YcbB/YkuD